jgi:response regulator of citrate/malate metabolism
MILKNVPNILLIEDDESDIELFRMAVAKSPIAHELAIARNSDEAMTSLGRSIPDLIFMDVNLPGKIGTVLLKELKSHNQFKRIPVIILSTAATPKGINEAYDNHANAYLVKPIAFKDLTNALLKTLEFWLQVASKPPVD